MYESDDIIAYLFAEYGDGQVPRMLQPGTLTTITCALGLAARWAAWRWPGRLGEAAASRAHCLPSAGRRSQPHPS